MMAMMESVTMKLTIRGSREASGSMGSENRTNPYVPIFSRTPARMTAPAVGASVWASGSQVWKGNIGTLMAKPKKNANQTRSWNENETPSSVRIGVEGYESFIRSRISNV